jgi:hypothetical protein
MKKNLLMTAFLVVTAAFIGCSSDDNWAELQGGDPVPAKGTPMTVTVSDGSGDATRYTNTTTDNIAYFQMWAYNTTNVSDQVMQIDGLMFSKTAANNTKFTNSNANWPTNNTDPCFFYAVSENVNTGDDVMKENFEATGTGTSIAPKITYSLPTTTGIVQRYYGNAMLESEETTVVDVDNTKDFLVCTSTNNGNGITEAVNGSNLSLAFDHALADLEIAARFTSYEYTPSVPAVNMQIPEDAKIIINYIAIHGLKRTGTYNFNTGWTSTLADEVVYLYTPDDPVVVEAQYATTGSAAIPIVRTSIVPAGKLLIIPQSFTPWPADEDANDDDLDGGGGSGYAYVEVNFTCEGFGSAAPDDVYDDNGDDDTVSGFFPLNITNNAFVKGKKHKLLLNLNYMLYADGSGMFESPDIM